MANSFDSNFTTKLAKGFLAAFESVRVLSKNVNTQLLDGKFKPDTGDTTLFKRPTDYVSVRTAKGDVSGETASPIITGSAKGVVQDYFTSFVDYDEADEAIKMDELDALLRPMATRICTDLELDFGEFMKNNSALLAGDYGVQASSWDHISNMDAMLEATGVPKDRPWYASVNPFTKRKLASDQRSLGAGGSAGGLISEAHKKATITENYGGFDRVMTATTLASQVIAGADRAGTVVGTPSPTYLSAKDTMTQSVAVTAFSANLVVNAGEVIQFTGMSRLNLNTRKPVIDDAGALITYTATVTETVTLGSSGEGTLVVTGPVIYESGGAYNTATAAIAASSVVTLLGSATDLVQPNLFWHKDAFSIGSVPIKKLYSTDTLATSSDGLQFRVSKGSTFLANEQNVRIDFRPAYACLNPFFAGQGFGITP